MKVNFNGTHKEILFDAADTVEVFKRKISDASIYVFVRQKRFVSSRQIFHSPNMGTALLNLEMKIRPPATFFDLLELELDGDHGVWAPLGVKLPDDVPANPLYFKGATGVSLNEARTVGEYMPFDEVRAYTEDRLPSHVYVPRTEPVEPVRRRKGYVPSRCNRNLNLADVALKSKVFGDSEYVDGSIVFKEATFHKDGSMVVPDWSPKVELLVERMNRLVQFNAPCRRSVYDVATYARGGVDWVDEFEEEGRLSSVVPFRHVDVKLKYQRQPVESNMSPFLKCVATVLGVGVGTLKERLLKRVKRTTFPFYYNGALLRYFGTIQTPAYEDFLNYLKRDDRIDYVFTWELISRPGLFPNGVNLLIYDADRQALIFPTHYFSGLGYQDLAPTLAIVKEGDHFSPMVASTPLRVKEWYTAPLMVNSLVKSSKRLVVYEGVVMGVERKCLLPCKPTKVDEWADTIEYNDVRKLSPKETVDYLKEEGAMPRYSYMENGKCVGVWTEGMLFVPCEEGSPVLPLPELEAWDEFIPLKGVEAVRMERSRQRWVERRQLKAYRALHRLHGEKVADHVVVVDEMSASSFYFKKKIVVLRKVVEKMNEELCCLWK